MGKSQEVKKPHKSGVQGPNRPGPSQESKKQFKHELSKPRPRMKDVADPFMRHYYRMLKKDKTLQKEQTKVLLDSEEEEEEAEEDKPIESKKQMKLTAFQKAKQMYQLKQKEKEEGLKRREEARQRREEARKKYVERKKAKMKVLRQKTKKGQPIMKGRIELLLEKIQRDTGYKS
ncbi:unnamed protein product [Darwinula stevensoni]|uniref:rRNA-processing protein FYV7 n=1 Tax=Darwinula stevensoni TaxID=69355 RepID=A0A7R9ACI2_9CRUS|nr:unnamed protein product [Darwinula stevensoni]CAG0900389.1 unnamed protein product [Darwinula stevensoni]